MNPFVTVDYNHILPVFEHLRDFTRKCLITTLAWREPVLRVDMIIPSLLKLKASFQIDLLEGILHLSKDEMCSVYNFFSFNVPITISENIIALDGESAFRLAYVEIPDLLIEIPQFQGFKEKEMEGEVQQREKEADMANKRAALGRIMLATVGKIAPEARTVRPLPLDQRPGYIMPPYFSKNTVFYATDRTTLYAIKILHDGKVCVATFTIRMGESPERFLLEHAKKMENDRKLCWFGQLKRRDFRPDPYSEIFSVSHQNSSETLKYRIQYVPEYDSLIVDILDLASPTISRARYRRFELR